MNVHEAGGRAAVRVRRRRRRSRSQLVGRLVAAGFPVLEFSAHSAGLEDLFIEITEGRVQ